MIENLEEFIKTVEAFDALTSSEKCDYFVYYLTELKGVSGVKPKDIEGCFNELRMQPYSNVPQYLKNNTKKLPPALVPKFILQKEMYHLERRRKEQIKLTVNVNKH